MVLYMQSLSFFIVLIILIKTNFLSSAIVQPALQTEENIYSINVRKNSLIATAGSIFRKNSYFCNSFAIANLADLPTLPVYSQAAAPIAKLKYLISNRDRYAVSFVGGFRYYLSPIRTVIGSNIFCDIKHINCETFYQIATGIECLSFLELRANIFIPITKGFITNNTFYYPGGYQVKVKNIISAFDGWNNIEVGKRLSYTPFCDLYFSIAPYFLFGKGYGIEYFGLFRWRSILFAGIQLYQKTYCDTTDIAGTIGIKELLGNYYAKHILL